MIYDKNIMLDIDGVLADFVKAFTLEAHKLFGSPKLHTFSSAGYEDYNFKNILNQSQVNKVWEDVHTVRNWWVKIPRLISDVTVARINELHDHNTVIFCTSRPRASTPITINQTYEWLLNAGFHCPNVIISKRKGEVARSLDIDFAIDDKPENASCIHWLSDARPTKTFLLETGYSTNFLVPKNVVRVKSVDDFLDQIGG